MRFKLVLTETSVDDPRITSKEERKQKVSDQYPKTAEEYKEQFVDHLTKNGWLGNWSSNGIDEHVTRNRNKEWGDIDVIAGRLDDKHYVSGYNDDIRIDRENRVVHYTQVIVKRHIDLETAQELAEFLCEYNLRLDGPTSITDEVEY